MSRETHVQDVESVPNEVSEPTEDSAATHIVVSGAKETPIDLMRPRFQPYVPTDEAILPDIGSDLCGYRIEQYLSLREFHWLYRARHPNLGTTVVLKTISAREPMLRQTLVRHMHSECAILKEIRHDNIVRLWDFLTVDDMPILVLEHIDGESLGNLLRREKTLPPRKVLRIALEIVDALDALTRKNMIHRDLKPDNIMLLATGQVVLIDFGLATERDEEAEPVPTAGVDGAEGSIAYMSPEQIQNLPLDHRSDMYSLGVTLYECLTGERPFDGPDRKRVALRHLREIPLAPHVLDKSIPREISDFVLRLLGKKPGDRMADHTLLRAEIESLRTLGAAHRAMHTLKHEPHSRNVLPPPASQQW